MVKDNAVRNQKVFVRLEGVLNLQIDFAKAVVAQGVEDNKPENQLMRAHHRARVEAFREIIKTLDLPINLR